MTKVAEKVETPTLDERIARILKSPEGVSVETFDLTLKWARAAMTVAENAGRAARLKSVDPLCSDGVSEKGKAEDQEFIAQRLKRGIEALTPLHEAATKKQVRERWEESIADLELRVVNLSKELLNTYPAAVAKLVDLFRRCAEADKEVMLVNANAADGLRRLRGVENTAINGDTKIISKVRLPTLTVEGHTTAIDAWPLPAPSIGVELSNAVLAAARGGLMRSPSEAERIAESERMRRYYEEQEQGRERLAAEAAARAEAAASERRRIAAGG